MKKAGILVLATLLFIVSGCVPLNKFNTIDQQNTDCQEERRKLKAENDRVLAENREFISASETLQKDLKKTGVEQKACTESLSSLQQKHALLAKDYEDLQYAQQTLLKGSEGEIRKLMTDLQESQQDLQRRELEMTNLSKSLDEKKKNVEQMQSELNQRNTRLAELEKVLKEQESAVKRLKNAVSEALTGFENQGLSVSQKNGKVFVSLEEKLLFPSGSTDVDPKGATALKKLAGVLEKNSDISINIEGHTDDVVVLPGSSFKDNWDLSVLRATSIVRILLQGSSINPKRLTTSGRGEFFPVDPAKTTEARQKNRRTEIILSPKLEELYKLIQ